MIFFSLFRECKQKGLQTKCETRMALFWKENGELLTYKFIYVPICILKVNVMKQDIDRENLSPVINASFFATGCRRLRVDDVVLYIPQSYPFCSRRPRDLCQDIHPGLSKGACMCVLERV